MYCVIDLLSRPTTACSFSSTTNPNNPLFTVSGGGMLSIQLPFHIVVVELGGGI